MPEPNETVKPEEQVPPQDSSSPSEKPETPPEEAAAEGQGVKEGVSGEKPEIPEEKPSDVDEQGVPYKNRFEQQKRLTEKAEEQVKMLQIQGQAPPPKFDPDAYYKQLSGLTGGVYAPEDLKVLTPVIFKIAGDLNETQMKPIRDTFYQTQYEHRKNELKGKFSDFGDYEKDIDEMAKTLDPRTWISQEGNAVETLLFVAKGKKADRIIKEAEARGVRKGQENKKIEDPNYTGKGSAPTTSKSKATLSSAEEAQRIKDGMTVEEWVAAKEGMATQSHAYHK